MLEPQRTSQCTPNSFEHRHTKTTSNRHSNFEQCDCSSARHLFARWNAKLIAVRSANVQRPQKLAFLGSTERAADLHGIRKIDGAMCAWVIVGKSHIIRLMVPMVWFRADVFLSFAHTQKSHFKSFSAIRHSHTPIFRCMNNKKIAASYRN